jgi:hypothetical protein
MRPINGFSCLQDKGIIGGHAEKSKSQQKLQRDKLIKKFLINRLQVLEPRGGRRSIPR